MALACINLDLTINRTILELKLHKVPPIDYSVFAINRTILELKPRYWQRDVFLNSAINRTILELKLSWMMFFILVIKLLIEPFWN